MFKDVLSENIVRNNGVTNLEEKYSAFDRKITIQHFDTAGVTTCFCRENLTLMDSSTIGEVRFYWQITMYGMVTMQTHPNSMCKEYLFMK